VDLYSKANNRDLMRDIAMHLAEYYPDQSNHWKHWAFALKEMDKVEEAEAVALRGTIFSKLRHREAPCLGP